MNPKITNIDQIKIDTPCTKSWEEMSGNELVRYCDHCDLNVYNISSLSTQDAVRLVNEREGRLCVRFWQRKDGKVITADCRVLSKKVIARRTAFSKLTAASILGSALLSTGCFPPKVTPHKHTAACNPANQTAKSDNSTQDMVVVVGGISENPIREPNTFVYTSEQIERLPIQ